MKVQCFFQRKSSGRGRWTWVCISHPAAGNLFCPSALAGTMAPAQGHGCLVDTLCVLWPQRLGAQRGRKGQAPGGGSRGSSFLCEAPLCWLWRLSQEWARLGENEVCRFAAEWFCVKWKAKFQDAENWNHWSFLAYVMDTSRFSVVEIVCASMYMWVCMHTYTRVCTHMCVHYVHAYMCTHIHVFIVSMHIYVCAHTYMCVHMYMCV